MMELDQVKPTYERTGTGRGGTRFTDRRTGNLRQRARDLRSTGRALRR